MVLCPAGWPAEMGLRALKTHAKEIFIRNLGHRALRHFFILFHLVNGVFEE